MAAGKVSLKVKFWPDDINPARDIFIQAQRFHTASALLNQSVTQHRQFHLMPPFVVMSAFTAELYLKCLLTMNLSRAYPKTNVAKS